MEKLDPSAVAEPRNSSERAMRHDGDLLRMQTVKRADHLTQNVGGDLGVERRGLKPIASWQ